MFHGCVIICIKLCICSWFGTYGHIILPSLTLLLNRPPLLVHVSHLSLTISLAVRFEAGYCTSLSLLVFHLGTNICTPEDFLRKLNEIVSVIHVAQCLAQRSQ